MTTEDKLRELVRLEGTLQAIRQLGRSDVPEPRRLQLTAEEWIIARRIAAIQIDLLAAQMSPHGRKEKVRHSDS